MEWYYAVGEEQRGPVSEVQLEVLIGEGAVTGSTLVWREGMENWKPLAEARVADGRRGSTSEAVCSQCGKAFPREETMEVRGLRVCAGCKPLYLEKLREGVSTQPGRGDLEKVLAVARAQKGVIWCILAAMASYGGMMFLGGYVTSGGGRGIGGESLVLIPQLAALVVLGFQAVYVYRLAAALEMGAPLIWVLGVVCLSCIGLLLMLILSSRATRVIRRAGFQVGLMGANLREIEAAM